METRTLKPADGMRVRFPGTGRILAEAGEEVEMNTYWTRRLQDGDVVDVPPAKPARKAGAAE